MTELNNTFITSLNKQYRNNLIAAAEKKRKDNLAAKKVNKCLNNDIVTFDEDELKEMERRKILRKKVMTSRNDLLDKKLTIEKFIVNALRKKSNK